MKANHSNHQSQISAARFPLKLEGRGKKKKTPPHKTAQQQDILLLGKPS